MPELSFAQLAEPNSKAVFTTCSRRCRFSAERREKWKRENKDQACAELK